METKNFALLPCNGLDKSTGRIAGEVAVKTAAEIPEVEIICPVLLSRNSSAYGEILAQRKVITLDGCATRCATKLAAENNAVTAFKIHIPDEIKESGIIPSKSLVPDQNAITLCSLISDKLLNQLRQKEQKQDATGDSEFQWDMTVTEFYEAMVDKFVMKVPRAGYLFNENDCWVKVENNRARLGISDYLQTNAGDVMFVEFPKIGEKVSQFDDICSIESGKAVLQLISPVSGVLVAVNEALSDSPELLNEDPYQKGWMIELELTDFEEDRELLIDGEAYFNIMIKKAEDDISHKG